MKSGNDFNYDPTPVPLGPLLQQNDVLIEAYTRVQLSGSFETLICTDTKQIYQKDLVAADSGFFSVFPYRLLEGSQADVFSAHNNIVITHELVVKLFGTYITYVLTKPGVTQEQLAACINRVCYERQLRKGNQSYDTYLEAGHAPVLDTHAVQDLHNLPKSESNHFKTTLSLLTLAILLLVGGAINFCNLSLVKSFKRQRKWGYGKC
jgi:putative ABC transport system permease protein